MNRTVNNTTKYRMQNQSENVRIKRMMARYFMVDKTNSLET